jgi:hypothetical protein
MIPVGSRSTHLRDTGPRDWVVQVIVPTIEIRGLDAMQRELEQLAKRGIPYAARETLNGLAFAGRKIWQEEMASSLTLRNQFTARRALVERATGSRMTEMQATLGHTEDYMRRLEAGIGERARRGGLAIPTEAAAGQAKGSLPAGRKRAVRPSLIIRALGKVKRQSRSMPRKARNARAVREAIRNGSRLAYLELDRRRGIYKIMGGRKRPQIRKLYDLSRRAVPLPRIPTLQRSLDQALLQGPTLALAAIQKQLDRARSSG